MKLTHASALQHFLWRIAGELRAAFQYGIEPPLPDQERNAWTKIYGDPGRQAWAKGSAS